MDILYVIGEGYSQCGDFELKCSLRSIAEYGKNIDRVFVAGHCPEWLSDEVVKIPYSTHRVATNQKVKHDNIRSTIEYAVRNSDISGDFLISMDDHFYIREVDFNNYPYYIRDYINRECRTDLPAYGQDPSIKNEYTATLRLTRKFLEEHDLTYINFSPHINKHCTTTAVNMCKELRCRGIEPMCLWLNWINTNNQLDPKLEQINLVDIRINTPEDWSLIDPEKVDAFSTVDFDENSELYTLLSERYPNKCKYEK